MLTGSLRPAVLETDGVEGKADKDAGGESAGGTSCFTSTKVLEPEDRMH
jgi:hypothetical protein